jgi:hypothetical protein
MDAPQYVHVDVTSGSAVSRMSYYTHHSSMDVPLYVQLDVSSENSVCQMSYYTHHSNTDVPQHVSPFKNKKAGYFIISIKEEKHYQISVRNQLHKYYITTVVFFIKFYYEP